MKKSVKSDHSIGVELSSLSLLALAAFLLCSLLTFDSKDPSWFSLGNAVPLNACGRVGAHLSALLLHSFGLAAFLLPPSLAFVATSVHQREGFNRAMGVLAGMLVSVLSLTVFLTLQKTSWNYGGTDLPTGGAFGMWIGDFLKTNLNVLGASIVSLAAFCGSLAFSVPVSISKFLIRVGYALMLLSSKLLKVGASYAFVGAAALGSKAARDMKALPTRLRERRDQKALESKSEIVEIEPIDAIEVESEGMEPEEFEPAEMGPQTEMPFIDEAPAQKPVKAKAVRQPKSANWKLPSIEFLKKGPKIDATVDQKRIQENVEILKSKLKNFGVEGEVTAVRPGPVITLYEFKPAPGVKVARIAALSDDLAMALSATSVRILAPLPGRPVVGIEIPSDVRQTVVFREFFSNNDFYDAQSNIPVVMGKDIGGSSQLSDLARMPHLLVAGQTGSGKSVFMNGLICSLLYRFTPDEMRLILVDPKYIEFNAYQDIPHLLLPVVDDAKEASTALKWAVREMERRYRILAMLGARNLADYNKKVDEMGADVVKDLLFAGQEENEKLSQMSGGDWSQAFESDEGGELRVGRLPYIVVIIDELADLMMLAKKEVEISIARIAQKARAAGIHLVIATQRPSTDVITGLIKANMPSRVSFQLSSFIDSKTILDRSGAEKLLGLGDMLFTPPGSSNPVRLQGAYLQDEEIRKVVSFLKSQGKPVYRNEILIDEDDSEEEGDADEAQDELYAQAVEMAKKLGRISASSLQRQFSIGYNRAAKLVERMEAKGIVGPQDGARPREVLIR